MEQSFHNELSLRSKIFRNNKQPVPECWVLQDLRQTQQAEDLVLVGVSLGLAPACQQTWSADSVRENPAEEFSFSGNLHL